MTDEEAEDKLVALVKDKILANLSGIEGARLGIDPMNPGDTLSLTNDINDEDDLIRCRILVSVYWFEKPVKKESVTIGGEKELEGEQETQEET